MMKLRNKYLLLVVLLHGLVLGLSFIIFQEFRLFFFVAEIVVIVSIWISWRLYRQLIRPLDLLVQGADAIRDRDFNVKFLATGQYEMDKLIEVYNEMIDVLRTERTRQEQQHLFLEKLIATSPTGIVIMDYDEQLQQVNPRAMELLAAGEKELLEAAKQMRPGEARVVSTDGINMYKLHKSHFIDRGFPRHFIMIEELTAEIQAAEKKAYGKVIRMMAHEVNNTVGPVNSILQSALRAGGERRDDLKNALQVAIDRNHNLNQFMRKFADVVRLPEPMCAGMDLRQLVSEVGLLMEGREGEKAIRFYYLLGSASFLIRADRLQMEQVLINIIKNAMEAIEREGSILFTLDRTNRQLIIADSGGGISAAAAVQLFSPFFSTKKDGQGIGLTLVKEVLLNHGYEFSLKTVAPGVTEFIIKFNELI